jgi:modulator of FtsH protease HflK
MPWNNQSGGGGRRGGGGGGGPWGQGPSGGPHQQPDLEELLKRSQDRLKQVIPGGGGPPGLLIFLIMLGGAFVAAWFAFFFVVRADENAIVLRFGQFDRQVGSGLHLRLPPPIEEVRVAKVKTEHVTEIGFESTGGGRGAGRDLPSESLMLTGDENIVVVGFTVRWRIRDAKEYLFNIQKPDDTVKELAESVMREVVGQSSIAPLITEARGKTEAAVKELLQKVLNYYGAGIAIQEVNMQKSEPPAVQGVIDAFRDVQAAQADKEKYQNDATGYANKVVNEAKGDAERIRLTAEGYKQQAIAEAAGQAARFNKVYEEYKKAPEVTRKRLYLETMERVLGGADKIILDGKAGQGVVPYLPLDQLQKRKEGGN